MGHAWGSNAQTLGDLSGWFANLGGSVGEGPYFGGDAFGGLGQTGNAVFGGDFGAAVG
jgi:hypothetical protein